MVERTYAARGPVDVQRRPAGALTERLLGGHTCGAGFKEFDNLVGGVAQQIPLIQGGFQGVGVHGRARGIEQTRAVEFAQNRHNATGAVHVFNMVFRRIRGHFTKLRHFSTETVYVTEIEFNLGLAGDAKKVQDGIGAAAHGDIECHGVFERSLRADVTRQHALVVLFVIAFGQAYNSPPRFFKEPFAVSVGGEHGAVARQAQTERFGQTVHRVCGEHTRAGATGGAGAAFVFGDGFIGRGRVGGDDHRVDQIEAVLGQFSLPRFHRAAGDEYHRNVDSHGREQHPRGDFVAVRNAHQRVGAMRIDHIFHRVGDQIAAR